MRPQPESRVSSRRIELTQPVGEARGGLLDPGIGALEALSGNDADLGAGREQGVGELRQVLRIVLAVAVHGDDDSAARLEDAGAHGSTLPGRPVVADMADVAGAAGHAFGQNVRRRVGRAVIDDQNLVVAADQRSVDLAEKEGEVLGFVATGDDHRNGRLLCLRHQQVPKSRPC